MPSFLRNLSIRRRLLLLTLLTSGIGVLHGCIAYLIYDYHEERKQKLEEIRSLSELIATNATATLAFDDAAAGASLLESLHTRPHVRMAVLYRPDGVFFASYVRKDLAGIVTIPPKSLTGEFWGRGTLKTSQPVSLESRHLGTLYIEKDLSEFQERMRRSIWLSRS